MNFFIFSNGDWGLGIGDWGLGIGDWAQSPIPNPQYWEKNYLIFKLKIFYLLFFYIYLYKFHIKYLRIINY